MDMTITVIDGISGTANGGLMVLGRAGLMTPHMTSTTGYAAMTHKALQNLSSQRRGEVLQKAIGVAAEGFFMRTNHLTRNEG